MGDKMDMDHEIIIIGSGIGGLIAGCYLAKSGLNVLIVEQHDKAGGYCTSFKRKGYTFDAGVHNLGSIDKGVLGKILMEIEVHQDLELHLIDPTNRIIMPDFDLKIYSNFDQTLAEFIKVFPGEELPIRRFFDFILFQDFLTVYSKVKKMTFKRLLDDFFSEDAIKATFSVLLGNMGVSSLEASAVAAVILFRQYVLDAVYYPGDSMQAFPDALVRKFKALGGLIVFKDKVIKVEKAKPQTFTVSTETGRVLRCGIVLSNSDVSELYKEIAGAKNKEREVVDSLQVSSSAFCVYLGLKDKLSEFTKTGGCIAKAFNYKMDSYIPVPALDLGRGDVSMMVFSIPEYGAIDSSQNNKSGLRLLVFAPYVSEEFWAQNKERLKDRLLVLAGQTISRLADNIEFAEAATPVTMRRYTSNRAGAGFGWAAIWGQSKVNIIPQRSSIEGLYLAGHWTTGPMGQSGVPGVSLSGRKAAELIINDLGKKWEYPLIKL